MLVGLLYILAWKIDDISLSSKKFLISVNRVPDFAYQPGRKGVRVTDSGLDCS